MRWPPQSATATACSPPGRSAPACSTCAITSPPRSTLAACRSSSTSPFRSSCSARVVELTEAALPEGARLYAFGHLAEGNLHLNVLGAGDDAAAITERPRPGRRLGGTVSAEHGIGVAKVAWLERVKGPAAASALLAIKHALDPTGILNPRRAVPLIDATSVAVLLGRVELGLGDQGAHRQAGLGQRRAAIGAAVDHADDVLDDGAEGAQVVGRDAPPGRRW